MVQTPDIQATACLDPISFFRVKIDETFNEKTANSLRQALNSFLRFLDGTPIQSDTIDSGLLSRWIAWLLYEGYSRKTALYYLKNLSALYGKAVENGIVSPTDAFTLIREKVQNLPEIMFETCYDRDTLIKLRRLWQAADKGTHEHQLAVDVTLFAILCGGLTFEQIIKYKKSDYQGNDPALLKIVDKYAQPRNKYLFPLRQSERTPAQLRKELKKLFAEALVSVSLQPAVVIEETALELWCTAAMDCNLTPEVVGGCVNKLPALNPIFALCGTENLGEAEKLRIKNFVSLAIADNPMQWHAMQFRPHVSFESVQARIDLFSNEVHLDSIYYPLMEITRRIGNRMRDDKRPVISGLMYFRCRVSDLVPLFRNIGDLAWGYRVGGRSGRPYAVIPDWEIHRLQTAIGIFTPEAELLPIGSIPLKKGDKLEIIGGIFNGKEARFDSETVIKSGTDSGKTVYRLLMPDGNGFEWELTIDPRMVRRVSESQ